ncbi:MAG: hypothetical protein GY822_18010 [Deltaproteobacteria bacterium]|nr:hypothetical protein [Deltaproteobacteria bacterium]
MPESNPVRPSITAFSLTNYRAFQKGDVKLGRVTLLLGKNNAGKTALCLAPIYFAHAFDPQATAPFATDDGFGSPQSAIYKRGLSGTEICFHLAQRQIVQLGVTVIPEENHLQQITKFCYGGFQDDSGDSLATNRIKWTLIKEMIAELPGLRGLHKEIGGLIGVRPLPPQYMTQDATQSSDVGLNGEDAGVMLLNSDDEGLTALNQWFAKLNIKLSLKNQMTSLKSWQKAHQAKRLTLFTAVQASLKSCL